ncbi:MAG: rhomboid family intramembrane serine protease [Gammaproteobacteria bacterium]|nr:rhomboid family intramembrane serine protease [Gammaproteobacteria bacterium]
MPYREVLGPGAALPLHGSERWAVRTGNLTRHLENRSAVRSELQRWTPIAQMLLGGQVHDNAAGVSGGAYALGALVLAAAWRRSGTLPLGLAPQLLGLMAIGILGSELSSPAAATTAHVAGVFVGAVMGMALGSGPALNAS